MNLHVPSRLPLALLAFVAARAAAQGPQFHLDIRQDQGQMVWIAMAPDLLAAQAIPGVEGLLRLGGPGTVVWTAAPADARGKSRNVVPSFAFAAGYRWNAQLAAFDAQGIRLTQPFRVDGHGIAGVSAFTAQGMPRDQLQRLDAPDDPRPAAVDFVLATGDTVFHLDARRNPVVGPPQPGRPGIRTTAGNESGTDMSGLSVVALGDLSKFPQAATVKLFMTFPGDPGYFHQGSGILIDPKHVLTAGHCAYDKDLGGYADKIWVVPGYSATGAATNVPWVTAMSNWGGVEPNGHSDVVDVETWSDWRTDRDFKHDVAVLELNRPIGALTGWLGITYQLDCDFYKDTTFYLRGYPGEGPYNGSRMYYQDGTFDSCPTKWEARFEQLSYGSQSGSGFYRLDSNGNRWVHGVLSHAPGWYPNKTDCVRLRDEKCDDINDWMDDHRGTVADLTPLSVRCTTAVVGLPSGFARGSSYTIEFACHNYSRASRSGSLTYSIMISSDDTISTTDTRLLAGSRSSVAIGALDTLDLHDTVTIPTGLAAGTWYIGVILQTADGRSGNQITLAQDVLKITVW